MQAMQGHKAGLELVYANRRVRVSHSDAELIIQRERKQSLLKDAAFGCCAILSKGITG